MIARKNPFEQLPTIAVESDNVNVLFSAEQFRTHLIDAIQNAQRRIYIVALYLEADDAGRTILTEIYEAKQKNPALDVCICVDWHRAQRGRIGEGASKGNAVMYEDFADRYEHPIPVYGIPVRSREVFGVLHLKGFIIDDHVIYSGASLNDVYLHFHDRYRYDRYHTIDNGDLANSMVNFIQEEMVANPVVYDLSHHHRPSTKELKQDIKQFRSRLAQSSYHLQDQDVQLGQVGVTPLVGLGKRRNKLNQYIIDLIAQAQNEIVICTPYFNFPKCISAQLKKALKRNVKVHIVIGDKTANDFYISPEEEFKTIGGLPYLYELNLRRFTRLNEARIASRQLSIHLWKHEGHSFHLKGMWVDKKYMLITGNNINPRAWKLDLENGLFIQDKQLLLKDKFEKELNTILEHTHLIGSYKQLDTLDSYPIEVQKLIKRILRIKADRILKQIL